MTSKDVADAALASLVATVVLNVAQERSSWFAQWGTMPDAKRVEMWTSSALLLVLRGLPTKSPFRARLIDWRRRVAPPAIRAGRFTDPTEKEFAAAGIKIEQPE